MSLPHLLPAKRLAARAVRQTLLRYVRARPRSKDLEGRDRRVFILLQSAWGMGGTIRAGHNLAGYLARRGYEVELVSAVRFRDTPFFGSFPPGVTASALDDRRPGATPRGLRTIRRLASARSSVFMHPYDRAAPHWNLWVDLRLVHKLRRRTGFLVGTRPGLNLIAADLSPPGLVTIGQEQMHLRIHNTVLRQAMGRRYPRLDALVALTHEDVGRYRKLLNARTRLARIPNTVHDLDERRADLRARTVLAAGRLTRQKGFDLLVAAYERVASEYPDWRVRICGKGELREDLGRLIAERGLEGVVELAGPSERLGDEMTEASIFVLSSRSEGFPLVLLEAMGKGMAVVSFDCPTGPGDIIEDHRNGLLVPAGDVEALGAGIRELIEDEELRRRLAAAAVETARDYTVEAVGPQWESLLAELRRPVIGAVGR